MYLKLFVDLATYMGKDENMEAQNKNAGHESGSRSFMLDHL